jgi:hypothetical protein
MELFDPVSPDLADRADLLVLGGGAPAQRGLHSTVVARVASGRTGERSRVDSSRARRHRYPDPPLLRAAASAWVLGDLDDLRRQLATTDGHRS